MKTISLKRRQFLRGAGGFTLSLPVLASLLPRAQAVGDPAILAPKRFVALTTGHGGVAFNNMYPADSTLTNKTTLVTGHEIRSGQLQRTVDGSMAQLSPVLRASSTALTDRIVSKMMVLRGLDIPFYLGHNTGGALGNFARNNSEDFNDITKVLGLPYMPSIDQLMAWSSSFYPNLSNIKERSIVAGNYTGYRGMSFMWSNPEGRTGDIQAVRTEPSSKQLFETLFGVGMASSQPQRKPVVDLVLEDFKRTIDTQPRLSMNDRQRLSDHMDRVAELQRRLNVAVKASCQALPAPTEDSVSPPYEGDSLAAATGFFKLVNEVVALALLCDCSRVATIGIVPVFMNYVGSWHQDIAHNAALNATAQAAMTASQQLSFEHVVLDLANRLDVEDTPGTTVLDNSLIQWTQESGSNTHDSDSIPVVTIGGAGGYFKTGQYADFRNPATEILGFWDDRVPGASVFVKPEGRYAGITYNRWLATALTAMGIPTAEWQKPDFYGYGSNYVDPEYLKRYLPGVVTSANSPLPLIT